MVSVICQAEMKTIKLKSILAFQMWGRHLKMTPWALTKYNYHIIFISSFINKWLIQEIYWLVAAINSVMSTVSNTFCTSVYVCTCSPTKLVCTSHQTFRMLNVRPLHKTMRNGADSTLGFPLLEELCIATTSFSYMTDKDLWDILFGSTRLRVLDLRGCSRITPSGLATLPCHGRTQVIE